MHDVWIGFMQNAVRDAVPMQQLVLVAGAAQETGALTRVV